MTKNELKEKFGVVYAVKTLRLNYLRSHTYKFLGDEALIDQLMKSNDLESLAFLNNFYLDLLKKDRRCERDLFSKNQFGYVSHHEDLSEE